MCGIRSSGMARRGLAPLRGSSLASASGWKRCRPSPAAGDGGCRATVCDQSRKSSSASDGTAKLEGASVAGGGGGRAVPHRPSALRHQSVSTTALGSTTGRTGARTRLRFQQPSTGGSKACIAVHVARIHAYLHAVESLPLTVEPQTLSTSATVCSSMSTRTNVSCHTDSAAAFRTWARAAAIRARVEPQPPRVSGEPTGTPAHASLPSSRRQTAHLLMSRWAVPRGWIRPLRGCGSPVEARLKARSRGKRARV